MAKRTKVYQVYTGHVDRNGFDTSNYNSYTIVAPDAAGAIRKISKNTYSGEYVESVELITVLDE